MKITMATGEQRNVKVTKRLCPTYKVHQLEVEDLQKLYSFSITDTGSENIYFNYQEEKYGEIRQGFCKV